MTFRSALIGMGSLYLLNVLFGHGLYRALPWLDVVMHATGGFVTGMLGIALWQAAQVKQRDQDGWRALWVPVLWTLGFVSFISVLWEYHEYLLDHYYYVTQGIRTQPSIGDTMMDLLMGQTGALISAWVWIKRKS